jgi:hypothetical protein
MPLSLFAKMESVMTLLQAVRYGKSRPVVGEIGGSGRYAGGLNRPALIIKLLGHKRVTAAERKRRQRNLLSHLKIFFAKRRPQKGYPVSGTNRFWTGFWERGHEHFSESKSPPYRGVASAGTPPARALVFSQRQEEASIVFLLVDRCGIVGAQGLKDKVCSSLRRRKHCCGGNACGDNGLVAIDELVGHFGEISEL